MKIAYRPVPCPVCRGRCRKLADPGEKGYCANCGNTGEIATFEIDRRKENMPTVDIGRAGE